MVKLRVITEIFGLSCILSCLYISRQEISIWNSIGNCNLPVHTQNSSFIRTIDISKNVSNVFLNLGSNLDPILPPINYASTSLTIAVEPIVSFRIAKHALLIVIPAAVSTKSGLSSMYSFNENGESSSLSLPSTQSWWNTGRDSDGSIHVVATVTLKQMLQALPKTVKRIPYLKTDIQGHDWSVIMDTGSDLRNFPVDYLLNEVYFGQVSTYQNVSNDFCRDWLPNMREFGYELISVDTPEKIGMSEQDAISMCSKQKTVKSKHTKLREGNALWKRFEASSETFIFQSLT
jgi:FkbM family methyltransferase